LRKSVSQGAALRTSFGPASFVQGSFLSRTSARACSFSRGDDFKITGPKHPSIKRKHTVWDGEHPDVVKMGFVLDDNDFFQKNEEEDPYPGLDLQELYQKIFRENSAKLGKRNPFDERDPDEELPTLREELRTGKRIPYKDILDYLNKPEYQQSEESKNAFAKIPSPFDDILNPKKSS